MEKRKLYEEKYVDNGIDNGVLVAPQTPGSEIMNIWKFEKKGDIYTEFENKQVTDIGG